MKRITDPTFRYTKAVDTDLRKTFARVRARLKREAEQRQQDAEEVKVKVKQLPRSAG